MRDIQATTNPELKNINMVNIEVLEHLLETKHPQVKGQMPMEVNTTYDYPLMRHR